MCDKSARILHGVLFIPLILETLAGQSDEASETIRSIGCLQGQRLGISPAELLYTTLLYQRLAVCLQRENTAMWANRVPIRFLEVDRIVYFFACLPSLFPVLVLFCFHGFGWQSAAYTIASISAYAFTSISCFYYCPLSS